MPHADETDPSITEFLGNRINCSEKEKICNYLNSGIVLVACYGLSTDVINPKRGFSGCPSMLTDGIWVWPGDLAYYVSEYSLYLKDEFIDTMIANRWTISLNEKDIDYDNLLIEGKKLIE